ncbi:DUF5723 family protein [Ekhidna sp.]|uniref:DUF5723 family protein n=1 Tax=Ekhidna sp. TaxID=2608089 RepID=UPI003297FF1E
MRKIVTLLIIILLAHITKGQSDLTFYHLGALTPQSNLNNASFFPDAKFYFSLPGLSGFNAKINSEISYNHLMRPIEGSDSVKMDLQGALSSLKQGDNVRFKGDVSLFQFGIRSGHRAFTLFANVRYGGGFSYPVNFLNYFVYGNGNFIGQQIEENQLKGGGIAYHEIGLGYSQDVVVMTDKSLRLGVRVKYLNGIAHASVADNASMTMFTDPASYDINVQFNGATIRTVGFNELKGDDPVGYIMGFGNNKNKGFSIDLGAEMSINDRLTGSIAINDLGFIHWKQDIENYTLQNSEVTLSGFDDVDDIDFAEVLEDSLDAWTKHSTGQNSFKTPIGARALLGANYKLNENGYVSGTLAYNQTSYKSSEIGFGVGYTHQFGKTLTVSSTVSKDQFRPVRVGGGFAIRVGSLQLYGAFDNILNVARKAGDLTGVDARIGINFLIGKSNTGRKQLEKKEKEELSPFPPEYDLDHLLDDSDDGNSKL